VKKVLICGSRGMVGSSIFETLSKSENYNPIHCSRNEADFCDLNSVNSFFSHVKPDIVVNCAAKVGGIYANKEYPADFIKDNLLINLNITESCLVNKVSRFINLGSSCIYPRDSIQPLKEEYLLTGPLEKTNEACALAKIAGVEMCRHYRNQHGVYFHSLMPTNLYGKNDNYHPENSHVLPALIRKFDEAKNSNKDYVQMWGTGKARREFMHASDLAMCILFLLDKESLPDIINVGTGSDITISELALLVKEVVGFTGDILYNLSTLDGTPVKRLDTSIINSMGWSPSITLKEGLKSTYADFLDNKSSGKLRLK
jgi:GDP-L-fucose synthase